MGKLSSRKSQILKAIVLEYINTAEPIGSRTLVKRYNIGLSPATIRNEMADLEELGFLVQPHTSAGRIPSQQGYRYFVDNLLQEIYTDDLNLFDLKKYFGKIDDLNQLITETASVLSNITNYTSVVLSVPNPSIVLKHLDFIQLNPREGLILFVTDTGIVQHKKITFNYPFNKEELEIILQVLKSKLINKTLSKSEKQLLDDIAAGFKHSPILEEFAKTVVSSLLGENPTKVVTGGTTNFLSQPEFNDIDKIRELLTVFEQQDLLISLLEHHNEHGSVSVVIGDELVINQMRQCSLITANFDLDGKITGKIGILGPQRMDYQKVIKILNFFTKNFQKLIE
ncbi:heat-inducible transcription repressor HrcA [Anaerobranca californiensis DSM 14826]|jgi:heat-inducible transcriptional repressor|uniref:Heat-inducible transcription repressor HrcA n=1 Tax=Anaerobranca californiensis DSM 14826 TaxID=1120989 RepID=A0A1M6NFM1_9FIRM|nr:heat-inducible transcriptional repressor HrcA [Anaerobranca californiensis]SHJ94469.1 heat-inducible transcription repressor HrcA [Anaerobranca californiensis DSM 14826]